MYKVADFVEIPFQYWVFLVATGVSAVLNFSGFIGWMIKKIAEFEPSSAAGEKIHGHKIVGFVEQELYLYALTLPMHGLITAVLLFKVFSGWLETPTKREGLQVLFRYYSYAIGNFVSLAFAILIFEAIRVTIQLFPIAKKLLIDYHMMNSVMA